VSNDSHECQNALCRRSDRNPLAQFHHPIAWQMVEIGRVRCHPAQGALLELFPASQMLFGELRRYRLAATHGCFEHSALVFAQAAVASGHAQVDACSVFPVPPDLN